MRSIYISVILIVWSVKCSTTSDTSSSFTPTTLPNTESTVITTTESSSVTTATKTSPVTTTESSPSVITTTESSSVTTATKTSPVTTTESSPSVTTMESSTVTSATTISPVTTTESSTSVITTEPPSIASTTTLSPSVTTTTESSSSTTTEPLTSEVTTESTPSVTTESTSSTTTESSPYVTTTESSHASQSSISTNDSPTPSATTTASKSSTPTTAPTPTATNKESTTVYETTSTQPLNSKSSFSSIEPTEPTKSETETSTNENNTAGSYSAVPPSSTSDTSGSSPSITGTTTTAEPGSTSDSSQTSLSGSQPTNVNTTLPTGSPSTSQIPTTTTARPKPPTTTIDIKKEYTINTENAVLAVSINVTFFNECVPLSDTEQKIRAALWDLGILVTNVIPTACERNETKKKRSTDKIRSVIVKTNIRARDFVGNQTDAISAIIFAINNSIPSNVEVQGDDLRMCDTVICRQESLKYKGFECHSTNDPLSNCTLKFVCSGHDCGDYGQCQVKANGMSYATFCSCQEDDMYKYTLSAEKCVRGDLSYKAWMIIAAGAGGLIILILLFAIVIQCARRKREPYVPEKYDDRETLMYDRSYDHIDQYHRKPSLKLENRRIQTSLQTFDNQGYDHWDPEDSKETYQSMDRHFQSPNFQAQITRPKLATSRYGEDKLTPF